MLAGPASALPEALSRHAPQTLLAAEFQIFFLPLKVGYCQLKLRSLLCASAISRSSAESVPNCCECQAERNRQIETIEKSGVGPVIPVSDTPRFDRGSTTTTAASFLTFWGAAESGHLAWDANLAEMGNLHLDGQTHFCPLAASLRCTLNSRVPAPTFEHHPCHPQLMTSSLCAGASQTGTSATLSTGAAKGNSKIERRA